MINLKDEVDKLRKQLDNNQLLPEELGNRFETLLRTQKPSDFIKYAIEQTWNINEILALFPPRSPDDDKDLALLNGIVRDRQDKLCGQSQIPDNRTCHQKSTRQAKQRGAKNVPGPASGETPEQRNKRLKAEDDEQLQYEIEQTRQLNEELKSSKKRSSSNGSGGVGTALTLASVVGLGVAAAVIARDLEATKPTDEEIKSAGFRFPDKIDDEMMAAYADLKEGDLVRKVFDTPPFGRRYHYAVVASNENGNPKMLESGPGPDGQTRLIYSSMIDDFKPGNSQYQKVPPDDLYVDKLPPKEEIVRRIKKAHGKTLTYDGLRHNCESFARAIVEGEGRTRQGEKASGFTKTAIAGLLTLGQSIAVKDGIPKLTAYLTSGRDKRVSSTQLVKELQDSGNTIQASLEKLAEHHDPKDYGELVNSITQNPILQTKLYQVWVMLFLLGTGQRLVPANNSQELNEDRQDKLCGKSQIPDDRTCHQRNTRQAKQKDIKKLANPKREKSLIQKVIRAARIAAVAWIGFNIARQGILTYRLHKAGVPLEKMMHYEQGDNIQEFAEAIKPRQGQKVFAYSELPSADQMPSPEQFAQAKLTEFNRGGQTSRTYETEIDGKPYFVKAARPVPKYGITKADAEATVRSELAAHDIAQQLGLKARVMPIKSFSKDGQEYLAMPMVKAEPVSSFDLIANGRTLNDVLAYCYLIGNRDRHIGNLIKVDGHTMAIDQGMAFSEGYHWASAQKKSPYYKEFTNNPNVIANLAYSPVVKGTQRFIPPELKKQYMDQREEVLRIARERGVPVEPIERRYNLFQFANTWDDILFSPTDWQSRGDAEDHEWMFLHVGGLDGIPNRDRIQLYWLDEMVGELAIAENVILFSGVREAAEAVLSIIPEDARTPEELKAHILRSMASMLEAVPGSEEDRQDQVLVADELFHEFEIQDPANAWLNIIED